MSISMEVCHVYSLSNDEDLIAVVMHCMRAEIQNMNEKGSIINASSVAGITGFAKNSAYTAAKVSLKRIHFRPVG